MAGKEEKKEGVFAERKKKFEKNCPGLTLVQRTLGSDTGTPKNVCNIIVPVEDK